MNPKVNPEAHEAGSLPVPDPRALAQSSALVDALRAQIAAAGGWWPFHRYMERALYAPSLGYYNGGARKFGWHGNDGSDFVTAPEMSPLFAATLARAVAQALAASGTRHLMEFGAGTGRLAAGLLAALDAAGVAPDSYSIVELSGELRARQRETLQKALEKTREKAGEKAAQAQMPGLAARVRWLDALPARFEGVVIGNEVLDAMPVRLFARNAGVWYERGVAVTDAVADTAKATAPEKTENTAANTAIHITHAATKTESPGTAANNNALHFADRPLNAPNGANGAPNDAPNASCDDATLALLASIEGTHDYVAETHETARAFTRTVCAMLARGAAFFIDYGFPRHEYYHAQRAQGTLMCHYRHRAHADPFLYPGLQDITAHVEFSGIAQAGIEAGADLLGYTSQARFLLNAGITDVLAAYDPNDAARFLPAANAVQKLVSEAEMGELFKVIAFSRGIDQPLAAFAHGDRRHTL